MKINLKFKMIFTNELILLLAVLLIMKMMPAATEITEVEKKRLSSMAGHLKPLGSAGPFFKLFSMDGFPAPRDFFNKYVIPSTPLVMRNAAKLSPAYTKWTDSYFINHPASETERVFAEGRKKENRSESGAMMSFKQFVETYNETDMYMVHGVPKHLRSDVLLPPPLQCEPVVNAILDTVTWFSSGGTKSVLHNDDVDNINCLFRGKKTLIFLNPHDSEEIWKKIIDHPEGSYSSLDVDAVDYTKFPDLADIRYARVDMEAGDCLYIPFRWYHQVNSFGSNLAVNVWWSHHSEEYLDLSDDVCGDFSDRNTLANCTFPGMFGDVPDAANDDAKEASDKFIRKFAERAEESSPEEGSREQVSGQHEEKADPSEETQDADEKHQETEIKPAPDATQLPPDGAEAQGHYVEEGILSVTEKVFRAILRVRKSVQISGLKKYLMKKLPSSISKNWDDRCQEILINYYGMLDQNKDTILTVEDAEMYFALDEHTRSQYEDVTAFFQEDLLSAMQAATFRKERELVQKLLDRGELDKEQLATIFGNKLNFPNAVKEEL